MPSGPRPTSRPGAGPGRGKPRPRTSSAGTTPAGQRRTAVDPAERAERTEAEADELVTADAGRRRSSVTSRAIALAVVFLILTISYATSLRIYVAQSADIASTQQEITERQARIAELQTDLSRWNNTDYVRTQARARLGWVMPGETGFRVIGEDGQPLGGGEVSSVKEATPPQDAWWNKLWGSVEAADQPAPAPSPTPTKQPTITVNTKPTPSPTPSPTPR